MLSIRFLVANNQKPIQDVHLVHFGQYGEILTSDAEVLEGCVVHEGHTKSDIEIGYLRASRGLETKMTKKWPFSSNFSWLRAGPCNYSTQNYFNMVHGFLKGHVSHMTSFFSQPV